MSRSLFVTAMLLVAACSSQGDVPAAASAPSGPVPAASSGATVAPRQAAPPVREGSSIARSIESDALYVADEDHQVLRVVPLPTQLKAKLVDFRTPGRPAQVLVTRDRVSSRSASPNATSTSARGASSRTARCTCGNRACTRTPPRSSRTSASPI